MSSQLPFLLRLLDDSSPRVRARVASQLRVIGSDVWRQIEDQQLPLSDAQRDLLRDLLKEDALPDAWLSWRQLDGDAAQLERAWHLLARWQEEDGGSGGVAEELDALARAFEDSGRERTPQSLSGWLFRDKKFAPPDADDFYNPLNSSLQHTLREGIGLPISLAGVFILVGARLGLEVWGCNFPGRFLAGARHEGQRFLFDPADRGRMFAPDEVALLRRAAPEVDAPAPAPLIIARVLRNMIAAYQHGGRLQEARFCFDLLAQLEAD